MPEGVLPCGCPEHFPDWDGKDIDLGGDPMIMLSMGTFLHMPMGYEVYLGRIRHLLRELELTPRWPGFVLSKTGWLKGQILCPIETGDSPSRHIMHMPSPFKLRVKLHDGDIGTIKSTVREMQSALLDSGKMPKDLYLSYLTCPNCADKRGGAKIMVMRRWEESARLAKRLNR